MNEDTTVLPFRRLGKIEDPLTGIAREGVLRMLAEMPMAEADAFVARFADGRLEDGRQRVVRHGSGPERQIRDGHRATHVQRPKGRDRAAIMPDTRIRFAFDILPKWARRPASLDALLRVCPELACVADRHQGAGSVHRPQDRGWGWGYGVLDRAGPRVSRHEASTLPGA